MRDRGLKPAVVSDFPSGGLPNVVLVRTSNGHGPMRILSVAMPPELEARLRETAAARDAAVSDVIRTALAGYLEVPHEFSVPATPQPRAVSSSRQRVDVRTPGGLGRALVAAAGREERTLGSFVRDAIRAHIAKRHPDLAEEVERAA